MSRIKIIFSLFLFLGLSAMRIAIAQPAQLDTVVVRDLLTDAYFYDNGEDTYLPLVDAESFKGKSVHFKIYKDTHAELFLKISSDQDISVFIGQKIVALLNNAKNIFWSTDSLFTANGNEITFTVYHPELSLQSLEVSLLGIDQVTADQLSVTEVIMLNQRDTKRAFNNFVIIGLIIIGGFLAVLYNFYPRVMADFFRFGRAMAMREMDENLLKSRPFTRINTLFYFFFSVSAAYLLICILRLGGYEIVSELSLLGEMIWLWVKTSGVIFLWLAVKFIIIKNFTSLFNIKSFLPSHYFNYIRLGFFIFMLMIFITILSYVAFEIISPGYYTTLFTIMLIAVSLRSLFLLFKLMNSAQYKFLHLFSYLCGTELIPLGIILFLGFNQPF